MKKMMTKEEREVLAAADYEVRRAELAAEFPEEDRQPWEAHEGEALSVTDFRALPVGSDEREVFLFAELNDLWNTVAELGGLVQHIGGMVHHIEEHLPCAREEEEAA